MKTVAVEDFTKEALAILKAYEGATDEAIDKASKTAAQAAVAELRVTSPKLTGEYAKAWKYKKNNYRGGKIVGKIVVNEEHGHLTHLLEFGHPIRNKAGGETYGRTREFPHIGKADENAQALFYSELRKEIEKL